MSATNGEIGLRAPALLCGLVLLAACQLDEASDDAAEVVDTSTISLLEPGDTLEAAAADPDGALDVLASAPLLAPGVDGESANRGTVRVYRAPVEAEGMVHVVLEVNGVAPGPHEVTLHTGACDRSGAPLSVRLGGESGGIGPPLVVREDGFGELNALVPTGRIQGGTLGSSRHSVRILGAEDEASDVSACADL